MKIKQIVILFFMLAGLSWAGVSSAWEMHDAQGNVISSKNFEHKWLILNYWASWCDSCREETPEFNSFYEMNKDKNVVLYGVNYDHLTGNELTSDINAMGIKFPNLAEDPSVMYALGELEVLPVTFIINPDGKVVKKIMGRSSAESLNDVLNYLRKK
ncbi:MAG: TlpA disulfide reductase family protein [Gammaproteobacteria bacterium]|nr:TlpA disulfide reductase family protein [Gammaproteobacteria bacterium]